MSINWQDVKKQSNDFSMVGALAGVANNEEFKSGYVDLQNSEYNARSYFWGTLSAITDDIGQIIYENVTNYIDNVGNVDLCKVAALKSMTSQLGLSYSLLNDISTLPIEVQNLIDVLSIKREYLTDTRKIADVLVDYIKAEAEVTLSAEGGIPCSPYLDRINLRRAMKKIFQDLLTDMVFMEYAGSTDRIYKGLSADLLITKPPSHNNTAEIIALKADLGVPMNFDEVEATDLIEAGTKLKDDYTVEERKVIALEIARRAASPDLTKKQMRYSFYREEKVKEYFSFIEQHYTQLHQAERLDTAERYDVDSNYITTDISIDHLIDADDLTVNMSMISDVADWLCSVVQSVEELRSDIKTQTQKTYMKGTFLLLSYYINEYLKANVRVPNGDGTKKITSDSVISPVEYVDPTHYFNISKDSEYWHRIVGKAMTFGLDKNSILSTQWTDEGTTGRAFNAAALTNFYCKSLAAPSNDSTISSTSTLSAFLDAIFSAGAISADVNDLPDAMSAYIKYANTPTAPTPYYYLDNTDHPSYQLHPYLADFMEAADYDTAIPQVFSVATKTVTDAVLENPTEFIGEYGQLINYWKNPANQNDDYVSRYERESNELANGNVDPIADWDGLFYPDAVDSLDDAAALSAMYDRIGVSIDEYSRISAQISEYRDLISKFTSSNSTTQYTIFKYTTDLYGNRYILTKVGVTDSSPYKEKANADGVLWIRYKDHPLAFPAFAIKNGEYSDLQQVQVVDSINRKILQSGTVTIPPSGLSIQPSYQLPNVKDIELATDRLTLGIATVLRDDTNRSDSVMVVANVKQEMDYVKNMYIRTLTADLVSRIDFVDIPDGYFFDSIIRLGSRLAIVGINLADGKLDVFVRQHIPGKIKTGDYAIDGGLVPACSSWWTRPLVPGTIIAGGGTVAGFVSDVLNSGFLAYNEDDKTLTYCWISNDTISEKTTTVLSGSAISYSDEANYAPSLNTPLKTIDIVLDTTNYSVGPTQTYDLNADMGSVPALSAPRLDIWNSVWDNSERTWVVELVDEKPSYKFQFIDPMSEYIAESLGYNWSEVSADALDVVNLNVTNNNGIMTFTSDMSASETGKIHTAMRRHNFGLSSLSSFEGGVMNVAKEYNDDYAVNCITYSIRNITVDKPKFVIKVMEANDIFSKPFITEDDTLSVDNSTFVGNAYISADSTNILFAEDDTDK